MSVHSQDYVRLTESHACDGHRYELQHDKRPRDDRRTAAREHVLKREQGVDQAECDYGGDDDVPRAETGDDAREEGELENGTHTAIGGHPQTNGRRGETESAELDRR